MQRLFRPIFALPALCLLTALPRPASARDYFVATTGNDRNPGSEEQPFASIRQAAGVANPGDNVIVRGGLYRNGVTVARGGNASAWITFKAYPGELPVLDGGGAGGTGFNIAAEYIRVQGIVAQNWSSSGFANGWDNSLGHVEFVNVVAEGNGINGIAFYKSSGVLIEHSIIAHNGNQLPSWSSGVNVFAVTGTEQDNRVIGNVSFENVDISNNHTDGNGFILDEGSSGALFQNNIGFNNGGSCIRLTNSSGAHLVNNTCFHNGRDPNNTPTFVADEIFFSDARTRMNVVVRNNLAAAITGKSGISQTSGTGTSVFEKNMALDNGAPTPFFVSSTGDLSLRLVEGAAGIVDGGSSTSAPADDIGFDPRCIKQQAGQAVAFWQYAPDYDYIESVEGVAGCFKPRARPAAGGIDIGAYEFGVDAVPCTPELCATAACASDPACSATGAGGSGVDVGGEGLPPLDPGTIETMPPGAGTSAAPAVEPTSTMAEQPAFLPPPRAASEGGGCSVPRGAAGHPGLLALAAFLGVALYRRRSARNAS